MRKMLALIVPTGILASVLTLAPLVAQEVPNAVDNAATRRIDDDRGVDYGWLGLIGLLGLAGLMRRDRHEHHPVTDRTTHR